MMLLLLLVLLVVVVVVGTVVVRVAALILWMKICAKERNLAVKENSFASSLSGFLRLLPFPSYDLLSSCEAVLRHFE